jgi:hypothetical protein
MQGTGDGYAELEAGTPDASGDAGAPDFCATLRAADPTVRFCAGFDQMTAAAPFGFTEALTSDSGAFTLVTSPFETPGGALAVDLLDGAANRSQRVRQRLGALTTSGATHVVVDFDFQAVNRSLDSVAIANLEGVGRNCYADFRLSLGNDGLHVGDTVVANTLGAKQHVRIAADLLQGGDSTFDASLDGVPQPQKELAFGSACDTAFFSIGTFFSSKDSGHAEVVFDHVVVRMP